MTVILATLELDRFRKWRDVTIRSTPYTKTWQPANPGEARTFETYAQALALGVRPSPPAPVLRTLFGQGLILACEPYRRDTP